MHEARLYQKLEDEKVHCSLCPHGCTIREGRAGVCGVRINRGGTLYAATYGKVSAEAVDPIEKKPLFHFLPGTLCYSLGTIGCNFHCSHCQNWHISQATLEQQMLSEISPEEGVERAVRSGSQSIAWTYNEPTIWHEYPLAMGTLARQRGLGTVYVTNGYITEGGLRELAGMLSAFRVDIKTFSDEFYKKVCGGKLEPVLNATAIAHELGMHIETVTLVIPGLNDSIEEMDSLIRWVLDSLGPDTPMHFTRFHPDYKMQDRGPTSVAVLEKIYNHAKELGLHYPYLGNVFNHPYENTYCPSCGALAIERSGYSTVLRGLDDHKCTACGEYIAYVSEIR
ncbi:AmmeMemoRadiSam system radical SAM enzyme [Methanoculleus sp. FWC-SCC1]|uniref:AmmeMemoRadiSam system radical SAM enzyme n=1 Tax=Methanoculleus frigidifontis TaxID=2584085 RepID=A0ABT8M6V8_9EURY|nr:AmmeMemoRadiSam system radical SAM enzyme [Methanoculleus sp. FWC-SCC1]MDN7023670.1 AmmeMemoRadiSam system radical SAM enzyme [Methanoculleus sp. FWC-SCC1]